MTMHPLEPLTPDEIARAVEILRAKEDRVEESMLIARVVLDEPTKDELSNEPVERRAAITVLPGPGADLLEAVVSLTDEVVSSCVELDDVRPAMLFDESINAIAAVMENEQWQQAMRKRGIEDFSKVQLDPWPAGRFGVAHETNRRITRVLSYLRDEPNDNGYARPIEGVVVFVDLATREVLEVEDHGVVPIPADKGSYFPEDNAPARRPATARHRAARRPQLHPRRPRDHLATVVPPRVDGSVRGPRASHRRLRRRWPRAADLAPRVRERDGRPVR